MAFNFRKAGTKAAMTSQVNALTPSSHPGQDGQLARVQAFIAAEIATFGAANVNVLASGHYDGTVSTINIVISPVKLGTNGEILSLP